MQFWQEEWHETHPLRTVQVHHDSKQLKKYKEDWYTLIKCR